jgi:hypothetical protein
MTPTARSIRLLRSEGWLADVVERWIPKANIRRDLFGFGDLLAVHSLDKAFLIVQATSRANVSARLTKARGLAELSQWLQAGGRFEVWGWSRNDQGRWDVRRVEVLAESLDAREMSPLRRGKRRRKPERTLFDEV